MTDIRLNTLRLRDFKGQTVEISPMGRSMNIYGVNGAGKTTIADAFMYLLFDKDSLGRSDFEIKNLLPTGEHQHGMEHSVFASISVDDKDVSLEKTYSETWTKKRGSAEAVFTGHSTSYKVDGVPMKKNEYADRVKSIVDEKTFRLLTSPTEFARLKWEDRRRLLFEVCGNVPDDEVVQNSNELSNSMAAVYFAQLALTGRSFDDHKKVLAARRTELNKEIAKLPVRIDEVRRTMPDIGKLLPKQELEAHLDKVSDRISQCEKQVLALDNGGGIAAKNDELSDVERQMEALMRKHHSDVDARETAASLERKTLRTAKADIMAAIASSANQIEGNRIVAKKLEAELSKLREKWADVNATVFTLDQDELCSVCGQVVPAHRLAEARQKAEGAWNKTKSESLEHINANGIDLAQKRGKINADVAEMENANASMKAEADRLQAVLDDLAVRIQDIQLSRNDYLGSDNYRELYDRAADIQAEIEEIKSGTSGEKARWEAAVVLAREEAQQIGTDMKAHVDHAKAQSRIAELGNEERTLAAEYEKLEGEIYMLEQFTREKAAYVSDRINSQFRLARFKLFEPQVNGGVTDCCEITFGGVPYDAGLNNGARINVGLDICRTLSEHYSVSAPIFVDNAESVTELLPPDGAQVVRLIVSENDKTLRMEVVEWQ